MNDFFILDFDTFYANQNFAAWKLWYSDLTQNNAMALFAATNKESEE